MARDKHAAYRAALEAERAAYERAGRSDDAGQVSDHLDANYSDDGDAKLRTATASKPSETTAEPRVGDDPDVCDVCGDEFASARGVAIHKSQTHKGDG